MMQYSARSTIALYLLSSPHDPRDDVVTEMLRNIFGFCINEMNETPFLRDQLSVTSIDKWPIFSILHSDFASNIKFTTVFGCSGNGEFLYGTCKN